MKKESLMMKIRIVLVGVIFISLLWLIIQIFILVLGIFN
ncbi:hypothetical protein J2Z37_001973 [Ammoniphilus resinae]|uniref:Uncharacterized protein n=1 Tax=Ammoniphilus resinae TaxID=861532 RepID=A0ABS4GPI5_9BACL|nr:hypothetical protein [Ammoniphilus resinae]